MSDQDYRKLDNDLAIKTQSMGVDAAKKYGRIGTSTQETAMGEDALDDAGRKKKDKEFEMLLFLDEIQRLEDEVRRHLDQMREIQSKMDTLLDDIDQDIDLAKDQANKITNYLDAMKHKDVDQMTEFMLISGLYDMDELDAMKENGSFLHEYEQFVENAISEYDQILNRLNDGQQKFEQLQEDYNNEKTELEAKIELAQAAGNDELASNLQEELDQSTDQFNQQSSRFAEQALNIEGLENSEVLRSALSDFIKSNKGDLDWSKVLMDNRLEEAPKPQVSEGLSIKELYNQASSGMDFKEPEIKEDLEVSTVPSVTPSMGGPAW
ncbi:hypothetical protein [Roseivirga spongicola]|uniref:hypothetical protein n=1 Tax=Roseivirga spongicola TaxID=333140 RepID=UPI002AC94DAF|nr:hypothetical protein [Roseivirga spongicola]WPZ10943.1 hypothetical protein T7867_02380 [Roseivirga spongicola]